MGKSTYADSNEKKTNMNSSSLKVRHKCKLVITQSTTKMQTNHTILWDGYNPTKGSHNQCSSALNRKWNLNFNVNNNNSNIAANATNYNVNNAVNRNNNRSLGENTSGNSGSNNKRGDVELNSGNYNNIIGVSKISTIIDFTRQNNINRKKLFKKFPLNKYTASEINNYVATLIDSLKTGQYECKRLATSQLMETSNHGDLFWRCPGCDLPTNAFPNSYKCFCGMHE
ncbi:2775_t:CDS:2 [Entrophospora sp. SA101]|nr:2775_t:CDS:2 [Entrophospora sp. SA101]